MARKKIRLFLRYASYPFLATLLLFFLRRVLFALAIFLPAKANDHPSAKKSRVVNLPDVLILVPCRDEESLITKCCLEISKLDYPPEKLQVVLISDGSRDHTALRMEQEARERPGWSVLKLEQNQGKAAALNLALARFPFGEVVYILDIDHRPEPDVLLNSAGYFADPYVAGITGLTRVLNPLASPTAYYSTVESWVNQMVTMRAKDRLDLAPALLGSNCAYRREALAQLGGFRKGAFSEDSDLTVAFYQNQYRLRFAEDVISAQQVPQTLRGYMKQHVRWSRGLNDVAKSHSLELLRNRRLSLPIRLELLLFSAGYLDRLALIGGMILAFVFYFVDRSMFRLSRTILSLSLLAPLLQIGALFTKERASKAMWIRLPLVPVFFVFDILAAVQAMCETLLNRTRVWSKTERAEPSQAAV